MEISITESTTRKVVLPNNQVEHVVLTHMRELRERQKLGSAGDYLRSREGKIFVMEDEPPPHHGSIHEEVIREATELDKATFYIELHISAEQQCRWLTK